MAVNYIQRPARVGPDRVVLIAIALMASAICIGAFVIAAMNGALDALPYLFLLPWIAGLAIVIAIPTAMIYYKGEFSLSHPIIFATASYFFPAFVVGGVFLAAGFSDPFFIAFIQDPSYNLPFTVVLVAIGFASLSIGFFVPIGARLGSSLARVLPAANYSPSSFLIPGVLLLVIGVANTLIAFTLGLLGYQIAAETETYSGLIYLSTLWRNEATFLLWLIIFARPRISVTNVIVVLLLTSINLGMALFAGNRGSLVEAFVITSLAFFLSGRRLTIKQGVIAGLIFSACLLVGIVYGTKFRTVKGSEARQDIGQYFDSVVQTVDTLGRSGGLNDAGTLIANFAERIDAVSSLAVVVSNYEQLRPYEESYGLDNNIWKDAVTFLIPRVLWPEKPVASHARLYSDLYFNYGENSFTITPIGDLLRNFGVIGVPIGMFLLGVFLRILYQSLVGGQERSVWRSVLYFMLLTSISYESFYGLILPNLFRTGVSAAIGVLFVTLLAGRSDRREAA